MNHKQRDLTQMATTKEKSKIDYYLDAVKGAVGEEMNSTQPIVWSIQNAPSIFSRMKEGEFLDSRHCFWRHGKTWTLSFSPKDGIFELYVLEKDENFFATFTLEIAGRVLQSKKRQFDRGMAWGFKNLVMNSFETTLKFIVEISPCEKESNYLN